MNYSPNGKMAVDNTPTRTAVPHRNLKMISVFTANRIPHIRFAVFAYSKETVRMRVWVGEKFSLRCGARCILALSRAS